MQLASEVVDSLMGLSPSPVGSDAISSVNWCRNMGQCGKKKSTHLFTEALNVESRVGRKSRFFTKPEVKAISNEDGRKIQL